VMLAKHGERDPVRLEQRAIEIMSGQGATRPGQGKSAQATAEGAQPTRPQK
jgi:hypothetical protein